MALRRGASFSISKSILSMTGREFGPWYFSRVAICTVSGAQIPNPNVKIFRWDILSHPAGSAYPALPLVVSMPYIRMRNFTIRIDYGRCTNCFECVSVCPSGALRPRLPRATISPYRIDLPVACTAPLRAVQLSVPTPSSLAPSSNQSETARGTRPAEHRKTLPHRPTAAGDHFAPFQTSESTVMI